MENTKLISVELVRSLQTISLLSSRLQEAMGLIANYDKLMNQLFKVQHDTLKRH